MIVSKISYKINIIWFVYIV